MPTSESDVRPPRAVTMSDLLAAGAAANAVSTPPDAERPGAACPASAPSDDQGTSGPTGTAGPSGV
ncbi:hypothetical protein EDD93_1140 [Streptomyces sp. 840.1]|uniref:hypothetical protein n=1 Tax=Streptomyces sp. 840.1 TaxID=2485152 RepID=UPI000F462CE2|nr:hypothetical protein [Streptomyces sp. 840.1]ROQ66732.1 hypothetical protein EDD93_1140 [Streptomyces sp. 840.1]